jgi:hypothetical protein
MTDFSRRVVEILRGSPSGLTSKQIAERLGTTAGSNLSSRLSKLAAYGVIGKAPSTLVGHGTNVYRAPSQQLPPDASK